MIRHKTLMMALALLWAALQLLDWALMVTMMEHPIEMVLDILFLFGAFSAVLFVWCYDFALKDTHITERRHSGDNHHEAR